VQQKTLAAELVDEPVQQQLKKSDNPDVKRLADTVFK
jgi:hypothetical protein